MAQDFYSANTRILIGKLESSPGTAETLTSADFDVQVRDPSYSFTTEFDNDGSKYLNGNHSEDIAIPGVTMVTISFSVRAIWGGAVATTPNWWKYMQACGLTADSYGAAGRALHSRASADVTTMTFGIYHKQLGTTPAAVRMKVRGAMGNAVMGVDGVGKPTVVQFEFKGVYDGVDTVANGDLPEAYGLDTTCADRMLMSQAYVGSTSQLITSWSLDLGLDIQPLYDQTETAGIKYFHVAARAPRLTMNPLMQPLATDNPFDRVVSGVTGCPETYSVLIGDTGINSKFAVMAPKVQQIEAGFESREGKMGWSQTYRLLGNGVTGAVADGDLGPEDTLEILQGPRS